MLYAFERELVILGRILALEDQNFIRSFPTQV